MNNIFINTSIINDMTKKNVIHNNEKVLNVKGYSYKTYITNNYKSHIGYVENNLYKRSDNKTFNNTNNIYKHINQYKSDVFNNGKMNKTHIAKKTYYNYNIDVFINKHNTINTNDTYSITNNVDLYNVTGNNCYIKKSIILDTSPTILRTRPNHNNYEHNVIKQLHKHIKHINNYGTELNYYNKKPLDKKRYYNFCHDNFSFRKLKTPH